MAITIILICLALQRWLQIDQIPRSELWFAHYYQWIKDRFSRYDWWPTWLGVAIVVLPALVIYLLFTSLVHHLLSIVGYYMLALVITLYAIDARQLTQAEESRYSPAQLLIHIYQRLFAVVFWLLILGSSGVVLYMLLVYLCRLLATMPEDSQADSLLANARYIQAILDWVPLRLLGFTFALVGQFSTTFSIGYRNLWTGLLQGREQMAACGLAAVGVESTETVTPTQWPLLEGLVNRALWVWLVVIALFTIGRWIG